MPRACSPCCRWGKCGTEIEICAEGGDEAAAVKAVAAFIANMSE